MADELSSLSFKIKGDVDASAQQIKSLADSLRALSEAAQNLKPKSIEQMGVGMQKLVDACGKISSINTSGMKGLSDAMKTISESAKTDGKSLSKLADGIGAVNEKLGNINFSEDSIRGLKNFASAVESLNGFKGGGVKNLAALPGIIRMTASALNGIGEDDISRFERFAEACSNLKGFKGLPKISADGSVVAPSDTGVREGETVNETPTANPLRGLANFAPIRAMGSAMDELGMRFPKLASLASSTGSALKTAFSSGVQIASKGLRSLVGVVGSATGAFMRMATSTIGSLFSRTIKSAISPVQTLATKVSGLARTIGRLALFRAIRSAIVGFTKGIQEGISNLYQFSAVTDGVFKSSMDSIATSMQYLKNSAGAMASPLINAVAPAIDFIIDKFVTLLNVVNQVFAILTGASTWTKAEKSAKTFADVAGGASGGASKAASDLKKTILSFDEINKLNDNNSGGGSGGGGGGAGGLNYSDMFSNQPIDSAIAEFMDKVKTAFKAGDWESLGTIIGEGINSGVSKIPFDTIGDKLGYGINGVIQTAYFTLKTVDFTAIGTGIATSLNHALENIDFEYAGRLLTRKFTALFDTVIGFVTGLDWGRVGTSIHDFIVGAFSEASEWLNGIDWNELGQTLGNKLVDLVVNLKVGDIVSAIATFLGNLLTSAWGLLTGFGESMLKAIVSAWDSGAIAGMLLKPIAEGIDWLAGKLGFELNLTAKVDSLVSEMSKNQIEKELGVDSLSGGITNVQNLAPMTRDAKAVSALLNANAVPGTITNVSAESKLNNKLVASLIGADNTPATITSASKKSGVPNTATILDSNYKAWVNSSGVKSGVSKTPSLMNSSFSAHINGSSIGGGVKKAPAHMGATSINAHISSSSKGSSVKSASSLLGAGSVVAYISNIRKNFSESISSKLGLTSLSATISSFSVTSWARSTLSSAISFILGRATGGVYTNGAWSNIPQFAGGGIPGNHGSLFLAGEAGSELVGHVGGRTEVLNKSQLAATMYASVANGMITAMNAVNNNSESMKSSVYEGVSMAIIRQNELLAEQNQLLREVRDKDVSVEVSTNSINRANARKNQRDGKTVIPLGV